MLGVPATQHGRFSSRLDRSNRFFHSDFDVHRHSNPHCPCHLLHQLRLLHLCLHTRLGYGSCWCHGALQTFHQHAEVIVALGEPQNHRKDRAGVHRHLLKGGPWPLTCSSSRGTSPSRSMRKDNGKLKRLVSQSDPHPFGSLRLRRVRNLPRKHGVITNLAYTRISTPLSLTVI